MVFPERLLDFWRFEPSNSRRNWPVSCSVESGAVSRSGQPRPNLTLVRGGIPTLLPADVADIRLLSTFVENCQPLTQQSLAYANERHLVWAGAIGVVANGQQCQAFTGSPGLEGDRDGAAGIRGKARATAATYYSEGPWGRWQEFCV